MNTLFSYVDALGSLLDVSAYRQKLLANNLANIETPGYHRLDLSFDKELAKEALRQGLPTQQHKLGQKVHIDQSPSDRVDGNNVDIDLEMATMSKHVGLHSAYMQILIHKLAMMKSAISGKT